MRKHRTKIIGAVIVLVVLIVAWFQGERYNTGIYTANLNAAATVDSYFAYTDENVDLYANGYGNNEDVMPNVPLAADLERAEDRQAAAGEPTEHFINGSIPSISDSSSGVETTIPIPISVSQNVVADDGSFTVTFSVRVDTILDNMHLLSEEKHHLVPADGVIFPPTVVRVYEGESVFNVLQREMRRVGIHMAFRNTPVLNSAYVVGINNLYEFDVGRLSGWMYKVNSRFPNFGSSRYILSPDDVIEWVYTVDLGRDVGEYWLAGGQEDE